ncbi:1086_t:CDS:10, partial [Entrophospora sp. SA101]
MSPSYLSGGARIINGDNTVSLRAVANYLERDGVFTMTTKRVLWTPSNESNPVVDFFISTIQTGWDELKKIKEELTESIQRERSGVVVTSSTASRPSPVYQRSAAPSPVSGSSSPATRNTDIELRKQLLLRDNALADQHKTLVVEQKCINEEEFWELRKDLLRDQDSRMNQQRGRSSTMPHLRPVTEDGGEAKINITPQLIREIFDEYPRVEAAYKLYVPEKLSEQEFWKRYVQSKFNDRNKAVTSNGSQRDEIFDKCWIETEKDLNQESEHVRKKLKISMLRDLSATQEDHIDLEPMPDITMRPSQSKVLSLLRRNNRHSERILEAPAREKEKKEKNYMEKKKEDYINELLLEDLCDEQSNQQILLDIRDQREYFANQLTETSQAIDLLNSTRNLNELIETLKNDVTGWNLDVLKDVQNNESLGNACKDFYIKSFEIIKQKQQHDLPSKFEKEVKLIQLMGNEFLRHFWASYGSNVKEKMEKNKRMVEQLKTTLTKIRKLLEIQLDDDELQKFQQSQTKLNVNGANSVSNGGGGGSLKLQKKILRPLIKSIEKALTLHREFNKRKESNTWVYIVVDAMWPLIISGTGCYFAARTAYTIIKKGLEIQSLLKYSKSGLNISKFYRLVLFCITFLIIAFPAACLTFFSNIQALVPYDFAEIHKDFFVIKKFDNGVSFIDYVKPLTGLILFAFFGTGRDAKQAYLRWARKLKLDLVCGCCINFELDDKTSTNGTTSTLRSFSNNNANNNLMPPEPTHNNMGNKIMNFLSGHKTPTEKAEFDLTTYLKSIYKTLEDDQEDGNDNRLRPDISITIHNDSSMSSLSSSSTLNNSTPPPKPTPSEFIYDGDSFGDVDDSVNHIDVLLSVYPEENQDSNVPPIVEVVPPTPAFVEEYENEQQQRDSDYYGLHSNVNQDESLIDNSNHDIDQDSQYSSTNNSVYEQT